MDYYKVLNVNEKATKEEIKKHIEDYLCSIIQINQRVIRRKLNK